MPSLCPLWSVGNPFLNTPAVPEHVGFSGHLSAEGPEDDGYFPCSPPLVVLSNPEDIDSWVCGSSEVGGLKGEGNKLYFLCPSSVGICADRRENERALLPVSLFLDTALSSEQKKSISPKSIREQKKIRAPERFCILIS